MNSSGTVTSLLGAVGFVDGHARDLRDRLPELVPVGLGSSPRFLATARPSSTSNPTLAQVALDDYSARVAHYDNQSGTATEGLALVGRILALDLHDEDDLHSNNCTDNIQCM